MYDKKYLITKKINIKNLNNYDKKVDNFNFKKTNYNIYIDYVNDLKDLTKKRDTINKLNEENFFNCDSFYNKEDSDIYTELKKFFKKGEINIIILGAGPCGLYFANSLINTVKKKVNILFIENRVSINK